VVQFPRISQEIINAWTFQKNTVARNFYESKGFVKIKETDGADNAEKEPDILYFWSRK
jgi:putative acetyltransferase